MSLSPFDQQPKVWVMVAPYGLAHVGLHTTAEETWQVALGWPTEEEIQQAKNNGYYVAEAKITWSNPK